MGHMIASIICALLFLLVIAVRRVYYCVPAKELKRLARGQDTVGRQLYKVVAYDGSLAVLLWVLAGVLLAASAFFLAHGLPALTAVTVIAGLIWLGFAWLAVSSPWGFTVRLAVLVSPPLAWLLSKLHGVLAPASRFIRAHHRVFDHTGLYEREDLLDLLYRQKQQADSRLNSGDIELLERVLHFDDQTALDILTPLAQVRIVRASETIGPKLMDELHNSGALAFPVVEKEGEPVVGVVALEDLVAAKQGGQVHSLTNPNVAFVREDFTLTQVMRAFRHTGQRLLVVVNAFEEFVGVVSLESLLEQLLGKVEEADNFVAYEDRSAVARYQPPVREAAESPEVPIKNNPTPTPETPEVVE